MEEVPIEIINKTIQQYIGGEDFVAHVHYILPTIFVGNHKVEQRAPKFKLEKDFVQYRNHCRICRDELLENDSVVYSLEIMLGYSNNGIGFKFGYNTICVMCASERSGVSSKNLAKFPSVKGKRLTILDNFVSKKYIEYVNSSKSLLLRQNVAKVDILIDVVSYLFSDTRKVIKRLLKQDRNCHLCFNENAHLICSRCGYIRYCSAECQKKDWKRHKPICSALKRIGNTIQLCAMINTIEL